MDWSAYKAICDRPDVLSVWLLCRTADLVASGGAGNKLAQVLRAAAQRTQIVAPADFRGPPELRMVVADLEPGTVAQVWSLIETLKSKSSAEQVRALRLVGIEAAWREYAELTKGDP